MEISIHPECGYIYSNNLGDYELNQPSLLMEMKRSELMQELKRECQKIIDEVCPCVKIGNILPRWIMLQFNQGVHFVDPVFPYNGVINSQIMQDFIILGKGAINRGNIDTFINKLALGERCTRIAREIRDYSNSSDYLSNEKKCQVSVRETNDTTYLTFRKLTLKLPTEVFIRMTKRYSVNMKNDSICLPETNILIMCILMRYNTFDSANQQLAVNPRFYEYLHKHYGVNFELFGSAINSMYGNYCSIFPDLEKNMGSMGTFDNLTITRGFYVANPPYDERIMLNMTTKILTTLIKSEIDDIMNDLTFIVTIPVWEDPSYGCNQSFITMKASKFVMGCERVDKYRTKFFNYGTHKFVSPCDIYILLLQNTSGKEKYQIPLDSIISTLFH